MNGFESNRGGNYASDSNLHPLVTGTIACLRISAENLGRSLSIEPVEILLISAKVVEDTLRFLSESDIDSWHEKARLREEIEEILARVHSKSVVHTRFNDILLSLQE